MIDGILNPDMEITPKSIEKLKADLGDQFERFCDIVFALPKEALEMLPEEDAWKRELIEKFKKAVSN